MDGAAATENLNMRRVKKRRSRTSLCVVVYFYRRGCALTLFQGIICYDPLHCFRQRAKVETENEEVEVEGGGSIEKGRRQLETILNNL